MSVSFRAVGAWAELTADGAVAIPATPQTGDRMYLFARWKDFSVTAAVADWTAVPGTPFADGSTTSGNGTGSVKVGCWYRDWQPGDTDPTIDFSANPENASVVIIVMVKEANDVWLTPVAVTAAMTNWTTTSQTVAASSTANVLGGGVVMGLIGIRDDTATMTRPSSGIDDSSGAITWNGNYVESPTTHHTTTTGDDGAADLGYRLVSAGATATLRMTGTISAAETGAALWVVQGAEVNLVVQNSTHAHSSESPVVIQQHNLNPQNAEHSHTSENLSLTQVHAIGVQNASHNHSAENLILTQINELVVQDSIHDHNAESPALTQVNFLVVQDAIHSHSSDSPSIEVVHNLEIQNALHGHISDSLVLEQVHNLLVDDSFHAHIAQNLRFISIIFIDPGGDAVQVVGYPNSVIGDVTFDTTEKAVGVGSWKHDSTGSNVTATSTVAGVLGTARRVSLYFQYDAPPDTSTTTPQFSTERNVYSGGGFSNASGLSDDDDNYATATPAKNSGQGSAARLFGFDGLIPFGAIVDSVKIIYEHKYDIDTSEGISRVKWRVNGEEGPDHDNTNMPLTDTVVEVDITGDRGIWERQDLLNDVFEVIVEARRGDSDTEHTQSWDYVKVEVTYYTAVPIIDLVNGGVAVSQISLLPRGSGVVVRFVDAAGNFFDGITVLAPDVFHHVSFAYLLADADALSVNLFIEGIPELSLTEMATGGEANMTDLRNGWTVAPGANRVCSFDQLYIDDGDDLSDPGNMLMTAKLPATVNNDNFDTTGGTGAVNERPINLDNYRAQVATSQVAQDYTLEAADEGDVDISGETLRGYMGWLIAKKVGPLGGSFGFILNGNVTSPFTLPTSPTFLKLPVTSASYSSDAAGIGLRSATTSHDAYLYECGVIVAYEGPPNPDILLERRAVTDETLGTIIDDLRASQPDSYEVCCDFPEFDGSVEIKIYTLYQEGGEFQQQPTLNSKGRLPIKAGLEVRLDVTVVGSTMLTIWRRLNVD